MSFARFMELALYCPNSGYYEKEEDTIGRRGDFFTSASTGSLFGQLLAMQFSEWLAEAWALHGPLQLVEAGAHCGQLANDILTWLRVHRPELFHKIEYWIIEPSERQQGRQRRALRAFKGKVRWRKNFVSANGRRQPWIQGIIFSNELLDSMPVHRIGWDASAKIWFEWFVALDDERFVWTRLDATQTGKAPTTELRDLPAIRVPSPPSCHADLPRRSEGKAGALSEGRVEERVRERRPSVSTRANVPETSSWGIDVPPELAAVLPDGFTTEVSPRAEQWWANAAGSLKSGRLLAIDYGLDAEEFLSPSRKDGTLRAYHRQQLDPDVLKYPGEQDITAHVNFTRIRACGEAAGLRTEALLTQEQFLTALAARTWRDEVAFGQWTAAPKRQFLTLTHPEHLGRHFRVLIQSRSLSRRSTSVLSVP